MDTNRKESNDKEKIRREITRGKYGALFTTSSFPGLTTNYATKLLSAFEKEGLRIILFSKEVKFEQSDIGMTCFGGLFRIIFFTQVSQ